MEFTFLQLGREKIALVFFIIGLAGHFGGDGLIKLVGLLELGEGEEFTIGMRLQDVAGP